MKNIILSGLLTLIMVPVLSQSEEMILPSDLRQQTIITEPATLHKGFLRVGMIIDYGVVDKIFDENKRRDFISESTWASTWDYALLLQYGITDRFTADIYIPFRNEVWNYYKSFISAEYNTIQENSWDLQGRGLSDISLSARFQLITESASLPSLTGALHITVPTGNKNPENIRGDYDYDLPTGYGVFVLNPELRLKKITYPFSYIGYIGYSYNLPGSKIMNASDSQETEFKYGNRLNIGASFNFHLNDWVAVTNDLNYFFTGKGEQAGVAMDDLFTRWGFSYEARMVFQVKRVRLAQAVTIPLKGKLISADPLYVMLVQYTF